MRARHPARWWAFRSALAAGRLGAAPRSFPPQNRGRNRRVRPLVMRRDLHGNLAAHSAPRCLPTRPSCLPGASCMIRRTGALAVNHPPALCGNVCACGQLFARALWSASFAPVRRFGEQLSLLRVGACFIFPLLSASRRSRPENREMGPCWRSGAWRAGLVVWRPVGPKLEAVPGESVWLRSVDPL